MNATDFYNKTIGNSYDIDKSAGYQCVDLFKYFCKLYYGSYGSTGTGYADGYYKNRKTNGLLNHFNDMGSNASLQNGDWVFWGYGSKIAPKSHVAMYYNGKFLGQNQNGAQKVTLISMSTDGVIGVLRPKAYVTSSNNESSGSSSDTIYTVVKGDTLSEIATKYGTTYQKLAEYNGISNPNVITVGQQIKIPSNNSQVYYTVVKGDTLSEIAERYGTTVNQLASWNNISNVNLIVVGQKLRVK